MRRRIDVAAGACGRRPQNIRLLAVSKAQPAAALRSAWDAGQREFGESYLQEFLPKSAALADLPIEWHFIGPLQANKTKPIAEKFAWVHSVERLKIAERLSRQRPPGMPPLQICLQVNISGEVTKAGVPPDELLPLATAVSVLPALKLRGLMALPAPNTDSALQRAALRALRQLYDDLRARGFALDTLSMGMSDDLEAAIAEGATTVRVGSAIFGSRT